MIPVFIESQTSTGALLINANLIRYMTAVDSNTTSISFDTNHTITVRDSVENIRMKIMNATR